MARRRSRAALPQTESLWIAAARRMHDWVEGPGGRPVRPYMALVLVADVNVVRATAVTPAPPSPEQMAEMVERAVSSPVRLSGPPERPARLLVESAEMATALAERLAAYGIRVEPHARLAEIDELIADFERMRGPEEGAVPSLSAIEGVTVELVTEYWEAAAGYYRAAPWERLPEEPLVQVHYPTEGEVRCCAALGGLGEVYGIAMYDDVEGCLAAVLTPPEEAMAQTSAVLMSFAPPDEIGHTDLDLAEARGWPVAGEDAYPSLARVLPGGTPTAPTAADVALAAALLRTLPRFLKRAGLVAGGEPAPTAVTYELPPVHGGSRITLMYPVPELAMLEFAGSLAGWVEGWPVTEETFAFAMDMAAFLSSLLAAMANAGLADTTIDRHERNLWDIGRLEMTHGEPHGTFSPELFAGPPRYVEEFRREVSDAPTTVRSYITTWNRLARHAEATLAAPDRADEPNA